MIKLTQDNYQEEILDFLDRNELKQRELTKCGITDAMVSKLINKKVGIGRLTLAKVNNYIAKFESEKQSLSKEDNADRELGSN